MTLGTEVSILRSRGEGGPFLPGLAALGASPLTVAGGFFLSARGGLPRVLLLLPRDAGLPPFALPLTALVSSALSSASDLAAGACDREREACRLPMSEVLPDCETSAAEVALASAEADTAATLMDDAHAQANG